MSAKKLQRMKKVRSILLYDPVPRSLLRPSRGVSRDGSIVQELIYRLSFLLQRMGRSKAING